jgi:hypothetical protein
MDVKHLQRNLLTLTRQISTLLDRLSQEVISKYPDAVAISGDYGPIQKRDDSLIKKILAFVSTNEPANNAVTTTTENSTTATPLDEPTPEKKIDLLVNLKILNASVRLFTNPCACRNSYFLLT